MSKVAESTPRSPRQAQIDCSRQWIVGAYSQLITTMPDDKITISAICSTAGVGRQIRKLPRESLTMEILLVEAFEFWKKHQMVLNPLAQSKDLNHWFMEMFTRVWRRIAREFLPVSTSSQYDIEFQIAGINGVFLHWLKRDMKESPADIAKMIVNLLDSHAFSQDSQL